MKLADRIEVPVESYLPLSVSCCVCLNERNSNNNIKVYGPAINSLKNIQFEAIKEVFSIKNNILTKDYYLNENANALVF